jgi:hypothetical protein
VLVQVGWRALEAARVPKRAAMRMVKDCMFVGRSVGYSGRENRDRRDG